jgi:hypothetical protein
LYIAGLTAITEELFRTGEKNLFGRDTGIVIIQDYLVTGANLPKVKRVVLFLRSKDLVRL